MRDLYVAELRMVEILAAAANLPPWNKWSNILAWLIEFDESAIKDLGKLDTQAARRITAFLRERLPPLDDPRSLGEALKGSS